MLILHHTGKSDGESRDSTTIGAACWVEVSDMETAAYSPTMIQSPRNGEWTMRPLSLRIAASIITLGSLAACGGDDPTAPEIGPVAQMEVIGGDGQEAEAGTELPEALAIRLTDASGAPIPGQQVTFSVTSGGGSLFVPTAQTDGDGEARNRWTLGTSIAEPQAVEARVVDSQTGEAFSTTFTATVLAGSPAQLEKASGDAQSAPLGNTLPDSLVVVVGDEFGNPVGEVEVTWAVTKGGGSVDGSTSITDPNGRAATQWTLGSDPSASQEVVVTVEDLDPVSFSASATLEGASREILSGDNQEDTVSSTLPDSLTVRLTFEDGSPLVDVPVTWRVESGGGSVLPSETQTDSDGRASTEWMLGNDLGLNEVTAEVEGLPAVTFSATASPGTLVSLTVAPDSATLNALQDSVTLSVTGADQFGNVVAAQGVAWSSGDVGVATVSGAGTVTAEGNGSAWVVAMLGGASDSTHVTVSQVAASVSVSPATASAWRNETEAFSASVRDANGFDIAGATIAWSSSDPAKATVSTSGVATAMAGGLVSVVATSEGVEGSASLTVVDPVWEAVASLPQAVRAGAAATSGSRVYLFGGSPQGDDGSSWNQQYDPAQDSWSLGADLTSERHFAMAGGLGDGVHLVGGVTSPPDVHEVYLPGFDSWGAEASLPAERWAGMSAVVGGKLYIIGGRSPSGATTQVADVFIYDPQTDSWGSGAPMPTPRMSAAVGVIGGSIYVAGGQTSGVGTTDVLEVYDPASDSWATLASMPAPREALGGGAFVGRFCVFGGRTATANPTGNAFPDTWCYDPDTDMWHDAPDMLTPRVEVGSARYGGLLYGLGGRTPGAIAVATVERLKPF